MKTAYSIPEAAAETSVSEAIIRRALKATDPKAFPPPLRAKRLGNGSSAKQLIAGDELARWFASFPDA
jgi:hypothetical protein